MSWRISARARVGYALLGASLVSVGLYAIGAIINRDMTFGYLVWNLFLAWIPLGLMVLLGWLLQTRSWTSWLPLVITLLFVAFLPNTFYVITDIIHLKEVARVDLVYDVVMILSFVFTAVMLGIISIYLLHGELAKRLRDGVTWAALLLVILSTSFAIYIGRDLRWNSWDIVLNPASMLFEVSDRLLSPFSHPQLFMITCSFFVLITTMYVAAWTSVQAAKEAK